jgi:quinol monooxygenase YgiN
MVRASVSISVDVATRDQVIAALRSLVGPTRAAAGCLECTLYCDAEDDSHLSLVEEWSTEEDLTRRLRSKDYRTLLLIIELSQTQPCVQFDYIERRRGIEWIYAQRQA